MADIFACVQQNNNLKLKFYLKKSKDEIDCIDEYGNTALMMAAFLGHEKCVDLLLACGSDALHCNRIGVNALTLGAYSGNYTIIRSLLAKHFYVDYLESSLFPLLCAAVIGGNIQIVQLFILCQRKHPNLNFMTREQVTPIMFAAMYGRNEILSLLRKEYKLITNSVDALGNHAVNIYDYYKLVCSLKKTEQHASILSGIF